MSEDGISLLSGLFEGVSDFLRIFFMPDNPMKIEHG